MHRQRAKGWPEGSALAKNIERKNGKKKGERDAQYTRRPEERSSRQFTHDTIHCPEAISGSYSLNSGIYFAVPAVTK